nr:hypothetical protein [Tanacetum cinerariifolium]
MVAIFEKGEFNTDFHPMVDFIAASPLRRNLKLKDEDGIVFIPDTELFENLTLMGIVPLFDTMLVHQGEGSGIPTEPHYTPFPEVESSHPTTSLIPLPSIPTAPIPTVTQTDTTPIIQYLKRARIAQSSALLTVTDEPASPVRDDSQGEAFPTDFGFIADQDRATIAKSNNEGEAAAERIREAAAERISNDSEEIVRVLTSMDAANVLAGETNVPTGSGFIPTAGPPATLLFCGVVSRREIHLSCKASCSVTNGSVIKLFKKVFSLDESQNQLVPPQASFGNQTSRWRTSHSVCWLHWSNVGFHQALNLIFKLDEVTVRYTPDILRQRDCLNRFSKIPWVVPTFTVIEGE